MKSALQKIDIRFITRAVVIALLGMQIALVIIFLAADQMREASQAFSLGVWMFLALMFESKAYNLSEQKQNLENFLNNPSASKDEEVDSEGGEA